MVIASDQDFITHHLPGSGTEEDSYRIENKELGVATKYVKEFYTALEISGTSKYFIITDCKFTEVYLVLTSQI